jgi:hypothetical protein
MATEFDRLFDGFKWSDSGERFAIADLFAHVRKLEAKAAKFDALKAACNTEDKASDKSDWDKWREARKARKAAMK